MAALAAQVRNGENLADRASAAGRLARQLMKRGIELRDAISLAEKSLSLKKDPELALDLAGWWVEAGDLIRGAALLRSAAEEVPDARRYAILLEAARLYARADQVHPAAQTVKRAIELQLDDPGGHELLGSFGFWGEISPGECARSYLRAADLREAAGEDALAFENRLRAFEVDPSSWSAAQRLAEALRARGRSGAADEILREYLRQGSAAQRAAHHQRVFYSALDERNPARALESAFEAHLDLELDAGRLEEALAQPGGGKSRDFESFLVQLARTGALGEGRTFGEWLAVLCEAHHYEWGSERVNELRGQIAQVLDCKLPSELLEPGDEQRLRELRKNLGSEDDGHRRRILRVEIARRECALGHFHEAYEVFEPLLQEPKQPFFSAVFGAVIAGRARQPLSRARALSALGSCLPGAAGAVAHAVGAEMLLSHGQLSEAREACQFGVEAEPSSERAIASQALVALRSPEEASAGQLERSLSVLMARSRACEVLCSSSAARGAHRLAMTWAARGMALRPGDTQFAQAYLKHARLAGDVAKLAECLLEVLEFAAPLSELAPEISAVISVLSDLPREKFDHVGERLIGTLGVKKKNVVDALLEVAKQNNAPRLRAAVTERQLVSISSKDKASYSLALCRERLSADERVPAARALRRAVLQGADPSLVRQILMDFGDDVQPDGRLALLEVQIELLEKEEPLNSAERADILRRVGVARWDMAQDTAGAIRLLLRAAEVEPHNGLELFAYYLSDLAGAEVASRKLQLVAKQTEDPVRSGKLLGFAARQELEIGSTEKAFGLAREALKRAPLLTDLLAVAELSASQEQLGELQELYQVLARASLGSYGERAVHYRAARQLERRGLSEEALVHACAAFEAVPAEGVAFVLMARLADSTAGHPKLVASLQKVADASSNDDERGRWLAKAAALADTETVGHKERAELLLRAAQMMPEKETLDSLLDAIAHYLADEPGARDSLWERFQNVAAEALRHATGSHGAQLSLIFAKAACSHFDQPDFALKRLKQAVEQDIEIPDYSHLLFMAPQLASVAETAGDFVELVTEKVVDGGPPLGRGLAELAGRIAELLGIAQVQTELLVRAARDFPEDVELVAMARELTERDGRLDLLEVLQGLLPTSEQARVVLSRLDSMSKDAELEALLEIDLDALDDGLRAEVLQALAVRQESVGREMDAALSFRELLQLQPDNLTALKGVERDAEREGNYEELIRLLKLRRDISKDEGDIRRLQLRRAALLETRLGRAAEARELLSEMVLKTEDRAALRMLADSWQRTGDQGEAAELWLRVQKVSLDQVEADDAAYRSAACFAESGNPRRAAEALESIRASTVEYRKLGLDVARSLGDDTAVREQLIGLAEITVGDTRQVGEYFFEAARLAMNAGDFQQAEIAARRAKDALPKSPKILLLCAQLSIRGGLPASRRAAQEVLKDLEGTEELNSARQTELRMFLRAQATRIYESKAAAIRLLEQAVVLQGERPLLCLGLAELVADDPARALSLYETAIGGDLRGFREEGEVLLRAGELAREIGDFDRARGFVSAVSDDDPFRVRAARQLEEISLEQARARRAEREEARARAAEDERNAALEQFVSRAREVEERSTENAVREMPQDRVQREVAGTDRQQGASSAPDDATIRVKEAAQERDAVRRAAREEHLRAARAASEHAELAPPARSLSEPPSSRHLSTGQVERVDIPSGESLLQPPVPDLSVEETLPLTSAEEEHKVQLDDQQRMKLKPVAQASPNEGASLRSDLKLMRSDDELVSLLEQGDADAGLELLERLELDRARSRDALVVAQHLAALEPGDASVLGRLVTTAARDGNEALALSVRHVLGAYGSGDLVVAPPLTEVMSRGEVARGLLESAASPGHELLGLVWEHAGGLYKKDLAHYGVSGIERVPVNAPTPLGELYTAASRVLGMTRTAVFRQTLQEEIAMTVALLSPPAVIVGGEIGEVSSEIAFHFGAMLAAAAPEHALLFGCPPEDVQTLLAALSLSFGAGATADGPRPASSVTRVAAVLWETIPARAQRRMSQLCGDRENLDFELVTSASRRALRRAGLITCGDLPTAVSDACLEAGLASPETLSELAERAHSSDAVADLLGFAISPEYAELRFREAD